MSKNLTPTCGESLREDLKRQLTKLHAEQLRSLLTEYHDYVFVEFPIVGFCEASIINFVARKYYVSEAETGGSS